VYRCLHGQAPWYLADHLITASNVASRLRASSSYLAVDSTHGRRAFSIAGPTVWNSPPDELRDPASCSDIKQFLNTILFSLYTNATSAREIFKNDMRYMSVSECVRLERESHGANSLDIFRIVGRF